VALDVTAYVHEELGEACYTPPAFFKELVRAGKLGQKIGAGFYDYPEETE